MPRACACCVLLRGRHLSCWWPDDRGGGVARVGWLHTCTQRPGMAAAALIAPSSTRLARLHRRASFAAHAACLCVLRAAAWTSLGLLVASACTALALTLGGLDSRWSRNQVTQWHREAEMADESAAARSNPSPDDELRCYCCFCGQRSSFRSQRCFCGQVEPRAVTCGFIDSRRGGVTRSAA